MKIRSILAAFSLFGVLALVTPVQTFAQQAKPQVDVFVACSDQPAYGQANIGMHAQISISAKNLDAIKTNIPGGTWLYVGKFYAASQDPKDTMGARVVGYSANSDSFTANIDGFINSIRNQDVTPDGKIKAITFYPGDIISIMFRRGPFDEGLPVLTEFVAGKTFELECPSMP